MNNEIGYRLKNLREGCGKTQKDIANVLGVTPAAYGKIEAGDRGLSSEYCIQLADYFGVTCDYLLRGVSSENIDICKRTGLEQETIKVLEENIAIMRKSSDESIATACIRALIVNLLNDLIQSREVLSEWAFEVENYCINLNATLKEEAKGISPEGMMQVRILKAKNALNASRFSASETFNRFFYKFCSKSDIISAFAFLTEEQKNMCFENGLFQKIEE